MNELLATEQNRTLTTPRRRYGFLARLLFLTMDLVYGRRRSLAKFEVLELIARVPYQAWESVAYAGITHTHACPAFARRIFDFVQEARAQQDNEQWHLLILEEQVARRGARYGLVRRRVVPQLIALFYYHVSWLLYVIEPRLSYALNADFEDHAEHEYMHFVAEHPELDREPFVSAFESDYGRFESLGDALRRIGLDEREHKDESLAHIAAPRFGLRRLDA
ncbi:MAG: alternative oxidase [Deltaproteobacteria bacterium]